MSRDLAPPLPQAGPLAATGRAALGGLAYLGGGAILAAAAARELVRPRRRGPSLAGAVVQQCEILLGLGLPLVGLVHVGMGSFLAMQSFFGATFIEGTGPVVVVGLARNMAPLLTGLILAGLLATRITPELRAGGHAGLDGDPDWVPDREVALGLRPDPRAVPSPARLAAARLAAAAFIGPILVIWGVCVGSLVGWAVGEAMLGIRFAIFFGEAARMLWVRDVVGVPVKGVAFALTAALFACHEGLRPGPSDARAVRAAALRAACFAAVAILLINNSWFVLVYLAGPPFGPTVLTPPAR
jgi:phospholipid/cholesterol/gamma-HCH transport system permease protein